MSNAETNQNLDTSNSEGGIRYGLRRQWLLIGAFFLILHPFVLKIAPALSYILVYGIPVLYLLVHYKDAIEFFSPLVTTRKGLRRTIVFAVFALLVIASVFIHGTSDYSYFDVVLSVGRTLLKLSFLALLVNRFKAPGSNGFLLFLALYVSACVVYVSFSLILILFPAFKELWFSIITQDALYKTAEINYVSRIGINGFAGFRETFSCVIGLMVSLYLTESGFCAKKYPYYITAIACFIGTFLYGRIGLALGVIVFILFVIWYKKIKVILALPAFILAALGFAQLLVLVNPSFSDTFSWATKPFIEFFTTGSTNNYSLNHALFDMRFTPDLQTILFGTGYYTDPDTGLYYMGTDLGYLRMLLYMGICGLLLIYYLIVSTSYELCEYSRFLFVAMLVVFIPFEFKGEIWYSMLPLLVAFWLMIESEKK